MEILVGVHRISKGSLVEGEKPLNFLKRQFWPFEILFLNSNILNVDLP